MNTCNQMEHKENSRLFSHTQYTDELRPNIFLNWNTLDKNLIFLTVCFTLHHHSQAITVLANNTYPNRIVLTAKYLVKCTGYEAP